MTAFGKFTLMWEGLSCQLPQAQKLLHLSVSSSCKNFFHYLLLLVFPGNAQADSIPFAAYVAALLHLIVERQLRSFPSFLMQFSHAICLHIGCEEKLAKLFILRLCLISSFLSFLESFLNFDKI